MKHLSISFLIAFLSCSSFAAKDYYKASIYLNDGTTKNGLATFVDTDMGKSVFFKINEEADAEEIQSDLIKKIIYTFEEKEYEYVYIKVYKGWKQVETKGPIWLETVIKGSASLYVTSTVLTSGIMTNHEGSATFHDYYIIRNDEPAAKLIATISTFNNNQTFRAKAPLYFSDYPELAKKIKNKTYTWKNLEEVVKIYNEWSKEHVN